MRGKLDMSEQSFKDTRTAVLAALACMNKSLEKLLLMGGCYPPLDYNELEEK